MIINLDFITDSIMHLRQIDICYAKNILTDAQIQNIWNQSLFMYVLGFP